MNFGQYIALRRREGKIIESSSRAKSHRGWWRVQRHAAYRQDNRIGPWIYYEARNNGDAAIKARALVGSFRVWEPCQSVPELKPLIKGVPAAGFIEASL